jgi:hypothetical protein
MATGKASQDRKAAFKGNKSFLPSKPCVSCGLPMTWRKRWAKTWDEVRYCSDACRRNGPKTP